MGLLNIAGGTAGMFSMSGSIFGLTRGYAAGSELTGAITNSITGFDNPVGIMGASALSPFLSGVSAADYAANINYAFDSSYRNRQLENANQLAYEAPLYSFKAAVKAGILFQTLPNVARAVAGQSVGPRGLTPFGFKTAVHGLKGGGILNKKIFGASTLGRMYGFAAGTLLTGSPMGGALTAGLIGRGADKGGILGLISGTKTFQKIFGKTSPETGSAAYYKQRTFSVERFRPMRERRMPAGVNIEEVQVGRRKVKTPIFRSGVISTETSQQIIDDIKTGRNMTPDSVRFKRNTNGTYGPLRNAGQYKIPLHTVNAGKYYDFEDIADPDNKKSKVKFNARAPRNVWNDDVAKQKLKSYMGSGYGRFRFNLGTRSQSKRSLNALLEDIMLDDISGKKSFLGADDFLDGQNPQRKKILKDFKEAAFKVGMTGALTSQFESSLYNRMVGSSRFTRFTGLGSFGLLRESNILGYLFGGRQSLFENMTAETNTFNSWIDDVKKGASSKNKKFQDTFAQDLEKKKHKERNTRKKDDLKQNVNKENLYVDKKGNVRTSKKTVETAEGAINTKNLRKINMNRIVGGAALHMASKGLMWMYALGGIKKTATYAVTETVNTLKNVNTIARNIGKMEFGTGQTVETQLATTERTRAIQAMQNVGISARSYLGQEAQIIAG